MRTSTSQGRRSPRSEFAADEVAAAFERLRDEFEAVPRDQVIAARLDTQRAAAFVFGVATRDGEPPRRARFEGLAAAGFHPVGLVDRLLALAQASWYARQQQLEKVALMSTAIVPEPTLRAAQLLRARMLRVLEHWCGDDPSIAATLTAVRAGAGYQDLANDLSTLADLYGRRDIAELIANDHKHVRDSDVEEARAATLTIFRGLGLAETTEGQRWTDLAHRAWTLLLRDYETHRAAGMFLFRTTEDTARTYPSLFSALRAAPRRGSAAPPSDPAEPGG